MLSFYTCQDADGTSKPGCSGSVSLPCPGRLRALLLCPSLRPQVLAPDTLQACQDLSSVPVKALLCVLICAVSFICIFCVCVCVSIPVANTHLALSLAGFRERELQQPVCGTVVGTQPWTSEVSNFGSGRAGRSNPLVTKMTAFSFP